MVKTSYKRAALFMSALLGISLFMGALGAAAPAPTHVHAGTTAAYVLTGPSVDTNMQLVKYGVPKWLATELVNMVISYGPTLACSFFPTYCPYIKLIVKYLKKYAVKYVFAL